MRGRRIICMLGVLVLVSLAPISSEAQRFDSGAPVAVPAIDGVPTAAPEDVGMSTERLERLDRVMQAYVDRGEVAGVVSLVARRGKVVHFSTFGHREIESGAAMTHDTIFRIASMTKPITSVALMMLYEEGYFQLRDPISKWLPEFADMRVAMPSTYDELGRAGYRTVAASRPITVQHILTHTAGLANNDRGLTRAEFDAINNSRQPGDTVGDFVSQLAELPLNFNPGDAWEYGNATDIVGHLVEVMSGQTLDEFMRERIFEPLDMRDTHFYLPRSKLDRFAALYRVNDHGGLALREAPDANSRYVREPHTYFSGNGGLVSTARDYFRFSQMMLNGGQLDDVRLLSRKTVELMTVNHVGNHDIWILGPGYEFGLGYAIVQDPGLTAMPQSVGSHFWWGAFATTFWLDPAEELIGIVLLQIRPYTQFNLRQDMATLTYQAIID